KVSCSSPFCLQSCGLYRGDERRRQHAHELVDARGEQIELAMNKLTLRATVGEADNRRLAEHLRHYRLGVGVGARGQQQNAGVARLNGPLIVLEMLAGGGMT